MLVRASEASARACSRNATRLRITSASRSSVSLTVPPVSLCSASAVAKKPYSGSWLRAASVEQRLLQRHAEGELIDDVAKLPAGRFGAVGRHAAHAPVIGMPTRTARTSIDRASGNCSNRIRRRRCSHQR